MKWLDLVVISLRLSDSNWPPVLSVAGMAAPGPGDSSSVAVGKLGSAVAGSAGAGALSLPDPETSSTAQARTSITPARSSNDVGPDFLALLRVRFKRREEIGIRHVGRSATRRRPGTGSVRSAVRRDWVRFICRYSIFKGRGDCLRHGRDLTVTSGPNRQDCRRMGRGSSCSCGALNAGSSSGTESAEPLGLTLKIS